MGVYVCVFNFVSQSFSNAKRTENNRMNPQRHIIQLQQLLKFHHSYFILSSTYFSAIFSSIFHFTHFTHTYVSVQRVFCRLFFFIKNLFYFVFNWRIITILCCFMPYINMNQPQVYICPVPLKPPSLLSPHPSPLGCHRTPDLSSLNHIANFHWLSLLYMVMYMVTCYSL